MLAEVRSGGILPVAGLPAPLERAVLDTGALFHLSPEWLNTGPRALMDLGLPEGALSRAHRREWGGLILHLADRRDQIFFKVYAAVDQGPRSKHFDDLRRLAPDASELRAAAAWARTHDPSDGFRAELRGLLRDLGVDDGEL